MNSGVELHSSNVLMATDSKGIKIERFNLSDTESQASSSYVRETDNVDSYIKKEDCKTEVCVKSEIEDNEIKVEEFIMGDLVDQYTNGSNVDGLHSASKADIDWDRQCNSQTNHEETFPENDSKIQMPKHNQSTEIKIFCSPCNFSNEREDHSQTHISQHLHNGFSNMENFTDISKNKPNLKFSQAQARPRPDILICHICSHQFKSQDNLKEHIENHSHQPQAGAFSEQDTHIRTKGLIHTYENFECTKCNFSSKSLKFLKRHISVEHEDEEGYSCLDCGQVFARKSVFQKHERRHRDGRHIETNQLLHISKEFKCKKCYYSSNSKSSLDNHSRVHGDQAAFKRQNVFQKLKPIHRYLPIVKDRPLKSKLIQLPPGTGKFKCQYCNHSGQDERSLRKHILTHMDPSELVICKCKLCEISLTYNLTYDVCVHGDSNFKFFECKQCKCRRKSEKKIWEHVANHVDSANYIRTDD